MLFAVDVIDTGSPTGNVGLGMGAATVIGLLIKFWPQVAEFFKSRSESRRLNEKAASEIKLHENDVALQIYKDLVAEWKGQVVGLNESLRKQDAEHAQCRAESAIQKEQIEQLEGKNIHLQQEFEKMRMRLAALETKPT